MPYVRTDTLKGAPSGGWGVCRATAPNWNFKNTDFVDTMMLNVLRDLPISQNQPLKSADV